MRTGLAQTRKRLTRPLAQQILVVIRDRTESFRRVHKPAPSCPQVDGHESTTLDGVMSVAETVTKFCYLWHQSKRTVFLESTGAAPRP